MLMRRIANCGAIMASSLVMVLSTPGFAQCHSAQLPARYEPRGGTVYDKETKLTWQRCSVGQQWKEGQGCVGDVALLTWEEANKLGGGWRLPSKDELQDLVFQNCPNGQRSVNDEVFP